MAERHSVQSSSLRIVVVNYTETLTVLLSMTVDGRPAGFNELSVTVSAVQTIMI